MATGGLRTIDQNGGTNLPRVNVGWAQEQALDLDAVSATVRTARSSSCRRSRRRSPTSAPPSHGLQAAGVTVSNSYGGSDPPDSTYGDQLQPPGHRRDGVHR